MEVKMGKKPVYFVLGLLTVFAFLIAGCSGLFPSARQVPDSKQPAVSADDRVKSSDSPAEVEPTHTLADPVPTNTNIPEATETQVQVPVETREPAVSPVEPKQGLVASDPTAAELASGQIQLVEFFAFW